MNNQSPTTNKPKSEPPELGSENAFKQYLSTHLSDLFTESSFEATTRGYEWASKYLPPNKQSLILDIGCGMGHFLSFLKNKEYINFTGVEIGPEQVNFIKQHVTKHVILVEDTSQFLKEHPSKYDLITMFNMIEHLPKSKIPETLNAIHGALKTGGRLIVVTGNIACFTSLFLRYIDFTHEVGFVETSLKQVLKIAGFNKIEFVPDEIRLRAFTPRAILGWTVKHIHRLLLRLIYFVERPGVTRPKILAYTLKAIAEK